MITPRDKLIIYHIEKYHFITIGEAYSLWFSENKYGYDLARKHLAKCVKNGHIKSYRPKAVNLYLETIFYIEEKYSHPTRSMVLAMNVYAELARLGADVIYYEREEPWFDGTYRSDAFAIVSIGKNVYSACIEVIDSEKLSYSRVRKNFIDKYTDIYSEDEPLKKLMEITNLARKFLPPKLVIISEVAKADLEIDGVEIISIDYTLQKLSQIFTTKIE